MKHEIDSALCLGYSAGQRRIVQGYPCISAFPRMDEGLHRQVSTYKHVAV
jgi:hypothetical protein